MAFITGSWKQKLKCENILDCELAMLPKSKKCKNVITWHGDFGMDQYVSWCLSTDELNFDTTWSKYEDLCKSQETEVRVRFDLDIMKWCHDHLLPHLGGKNPLTCAVESCQLAWTSADIPDPSPYQSPHEPLHKFHIQISMPLNSPSGILVGHHAAACSLLRTI